MKDLVLNCLRAVAVGAVLGAAAHAEDVTIETAQGPATIAEVPQKPVVLDIAAVDTLHAMGVVPAGVPDTLYVDYLDDVAKVAQPVGTLFEPDVEALAQLGPDLIVIGGRSAPQMASMSRIAPTVDMTIGPDLIGDAKARIKAYGALFDKQEEAAQMMVTLDEKLAQARAAGEGKGNALIVLTNGPKMSAYGRESRFGWLFDATGLSEAVKAIKTETHGDAISHEFIAEANPDWLFVIDRSAAVGEEAQGAAATLESPLIADTKAWKSGQVVYLQPTGLYIAGGGYQSITQTLDELIGALSD